MERLINFFIDSKGKPRPVKIAFRRTPNKYIWAFFSGTSEPSYGNHTVEISLSFIQTDPNKYGLSSMYDPDKPIEYDQRESYGDANYANTKEFNWNIVPNHYSGLEKLWSPRYKY